MQKLLIYVIILFTISSCKDQTSTPSGKVVKDDLFSVINKKEIVSRGDIFRNVYPDTAAVLNLYQGNGRFGCLYGSLGLHVNREKSKQPSYGATYYQDVRHHARGKFGADYLLPLTWISWEDEPEKITAYGQLQSFYDGTITTYFEEGENKVNITTWFDPVERDLTGIKIHVEGEAPGIIICPFEKLYVHYNQEMKQNAEIISEPGLWKIELTCLNAKSDMYVKTNADIKADGNRLKIKLHEGENTILLSVNNPSAASAEESLARNISWWNAKWENMGCLDLPDNDVQKVWIRTVAYILYSHNDDKLGGATPMGLSGNGWPFCFPQELSFLHPVLQATGNLDIIKSWIEYWAEMLQGMKEYTKRIFGVEGVFCPWAMPYGDFKGFHDPSAPRKTYYEIHNSGYLARMAHETGVLVNDSKWTEKYVVPLIRETALFYKNICKKETDGLWHLFVIPSMGQDENGGPDQKDYLCALYSAQYCFQKAIEYKLDEDGFYSQVLKEGLAFPSLMSPKGYYYSNQSQVGGEEVAGMQKHPVQLNDLAFLPVNKEIKEPSANAYNKRYEITIKADQLLFPGWTLGEFLIAGSRMGDVEGWKKDWGNLVNSKNADKDLIQVYESSDNYRVFYITTSGMLGQSLLSNVVTDWFGKLEIGRCIPWEGKVSFKDIYTLSGVKVSGKIENGSAELFLEAWKDCKFILGDKKMKMKKGEKSVLNIKSTS